jgi:iron(III) transport system ATP-binding protein
VLDRRTFVPPERRKVGMVFQDYALFPHLTVAENVAFGVRKSPDRAKIVAESLALVGLSGLENRVPGQLSGGQQQRVALARALAPRPDLVLLDEPFSNLDPHLRSQVRDEVRDILRLAGATAVLVTHDQEEALTLADRVAVMFDGQIAQCDSPERVYHRPVSRAVAGFIGDARFLPGAASGREAQTPLGVLPLAGEHHGSVRVLIRPEMIEIDSGGNPGSTEGRVERSRFTGRDQALTIRLESGLFLDVRVRNDQQFSPGERLGVRVRGPVVAFPD